MMEFLTSLTDMWQSFVLTVANWTFLEWLYFTAASSWLLWFFFWTLGALFGDEKPVKVEVSHDDKVMEQLIKLNTYVLDMYKDQQSVVEHVQLHSLDSIKEVIASLSEKR